MIAYYSIETVGHDWCLACEPEIGDDKREAWCNARRAAASHPEYCTIVYMVEPYQHPTAGRLFRHTPVWKSRPDPDEDPTLPRSTLDDDYEG